MKFVSMMFDQKRTAMAVLFLVGATVWLTGCSHAVRLQSFFMPSTEIGLTPQTMSGILKMQHELAQYPTSTKIPYTLAYLYLQGVRENADTDFYDHTEKLLQFVERDGAQNPEDTFIRGLILMGKHHFAQALPIGLTLVAQNPDIHRYYGLVVDAQIELGKYQNAIATLQTMADQHPDGATLSRIAYVREIYGDLNGAKDVMQQTIEQSSGTENASWEYAELARLWLPSDPAKADQLYAKALASYPTFAPALAGRARVAAERGDIAGAIPFAQKALDSLALPEYATLLGDLYQAEGNAAQARVHYSLVTVGYEEITKSGTIVDLERNRYLADHDLDLPEALASSRDVFAARPTIYAADVLAWTLFKNGQYGEAQTYAEKALATGSHDPMILFHTGLIALKNKKTADAQKYLTMVQNESPHFSFLHEAELITTLKTLR